MKAEVLGICDMLVTIYQSARRHVAENRNVDNKKRQNCEYW
jgi:hypothetical protein